MGFNISYIGFHGRDKVATLDALGLMDTGRSDETMEAPFSGGEIPGGWYILLAEDFSFVSAERLTALSAGCSLVACQVHEGIMYSAAFGYENGRHVWEVTHFSEHGVTDLSVVGTPPPSFESIRQRLMQKQETDGRSGPYKVDHIFDIPVEVAASVCNYRYGRFRFDWGEPQFTSLAGR